MRWYRGAPLRVGIYSLGILSLGTIVAAFAAGVETASGGNNTIAILMGFLTAGGAVSAIWSNINAARQSNSKMISDLQGSHFSRLDAEIRRLMDERDRTEQRWRDKLAQVEEIHQAEIAALTEALKACKGD